MLEGLISMMLLLVIVVTNHTGQLRLRLGENAIAILPRKFFGCPCFAVDELVRLHFDFFDKVRYRNYGLESNKKMSVIGHGVDRKHFATAVFHEAGDISVELFLMLFWNQVFSTLHNKYKVQVDL